MNKIERIITSSTEERRESNRKELEKSKTYMINAEKTLKELEKIEEKMGKFEITSFFRSHKTNKEVKGSKTSNHLEGKAIDGYFIQYTIPKRNQIEFIKKWIEKNTEFNEILFYPKKHMALLNRKMTYKA